MKLAKNLKHITAQPFVFATGAAALIHSTWSLGTLFSGTQPEAALNVHFIGWIVPALLIAFALDVGQISTSTEIREEGLTLSRGVTFVVFALATYYLQWMYMLHHMPALQLSEGVQGKPWTEFALTLRDAGIWLVPALLPLSTILYTFSSKKAVNIAAPIVEPNPIATYLNMQHEPEEVKPLPIENPLSLPALHKNGNGTAKSVAENYRNRRAGTNGTVQSDAGTSTE